MGGPPPAKVRPALLHPRGCCSRLSSHVQAQLQHTQHTNHRPCREFSERMKGGGEGGERQELPLVRCGRRLRLCRSTEHPVQDRKAAAVLGPCQKQRIAAVAAAAASFGLHNGIVLLVWMGSLSKEGECDSMTTTTAAAAAAATPTGTTLMASTLPCSLQARPRGRRKSRFI